MPNLEKRAKISDSQTILYQDRGKYPLNQKIEMVFANKAAMNFLTYKYYYFNEVKRSKKY